MKKRFLLLFLLSFLVYAASGFSGGDDWSPWKKLDDGALNGIEFSHKNNCPPTGALDCDLLWRFSSGYETDVTADYTIAWDTGNGIQEKKSRITLKPGENLDDSYAVTGVALDEVSVKIVAEQEVLSAARQEVEAERVRMEEARKQADENARKQEELREGEEPRQGEIRRDPAVRKPASSKLRKGHLDRIRREELYLRQQEQPRPRRTVASERRRREEASAAYYRKKEHKRAIVARVRNVGRSVAPSHEGSIKETPQPVTTMRLERYLDSEILGNNKCL